MNRYLTTEETSILLRVSIETVRDLCRRGVLAGATQDYKNGPWNIPVESVNHLVKNKDQKLVDSTLIESESLSESSSKQEKRSNFWQRTFITAVVTIVGLLSGLSGFYADSGIRDWVQEPTPTLIFSAVGLNTNNNLSNPTQSVLNEHGELTFRENEVRIEQIIHGSSDESYRFELTIHNDSNKDQLAKHIQIAAHGPGCPMCYVFETATYTISDKIVANAIASDGTLVLTGEVIKQKNKDYVYSVDGSYKSGPYGWFKLTFDIDIIFSKQEFTKLHIIIPRSLSIVDTMPGFDNRDEDLTHISFEKLMKFPSISFQIETNSDPLYARLIPPSIAARNLLYEGDRLVDSGDILAAQKTFKSAIDLFPDDLSLHHRICGFADEEALSGIFAPACEKAVELVELSQEYADVEHVCLSLNRMNSDLARLMVIACKRAVSLVETTNEPIYNYKNLCDKKVQNPIVSEIIIPACHAAIQLSIEDNTSNNSAELCKLHAIPHLYSEALKACDHAAKIAETTNDFWQAYHTCEYLPTEERYLTVIEDVCNHALEVAKNDDKEFRLGLICEEDQNKNLLLIKDRACRSLFLHRLLQAPFSFW